MEFQPKERLIRIWKQRSVPVIIRPSGKDKLKIRVPYSKENRTWLKVGHRIDPEWQKDKKRWVLPRSWFNDIVNKCLEKYGKIYIIQPFREQEKCAPACWNAKGHECNCSCMGANHGAKGENSNWLVISDAFATRFSEEEYSCRLLSNSKLA